MMEYVKVYIRQCCIAKVYMSVSGHIVYQFNLTTVEQNYTKEVELAMTDLFTTNWHIYEVYLSSSAEPEQILTERWMHPKIGR